MPAPQEDSDGRGLVIKIWSYFAPNDRFGQEEWPTTVFLFAREKRQKKPGDGGREVHCQILLSKTVLWASLAKDSLCKTQVSLMLVVKTYKVWATEVETKEMMPTKKSI